MFDTCKICSLEWFYWPPLSDHRFGLQPNDIDDGVAADSHDHPAKDDERPGNQKGNGKHEFEQAVQRYARVQ